MSMTCSKHVENYKQINTLKRICASSWAITKNHGNNSSCTDFRIP